MRLPATPPDFDRVLSTARTIEELRRLLSVGHGLTVNGRYLHWDRLRHLQPPAGVPPDQWWVSIRRARTNASTPLPMTTADDVAFTLTLIPEILELLHRIDQDAAGEILLSEAVTNPQDRARYLASSLIEEAITSSQIEGAGTTRHVAKDMIRTGRRPRDRSERMILNNWQAMNLIVERAGDPLTPEFLFELHRAVTDGTFGDPTAAGRLQTDADERVAVVDPLDGTVLHRPPPADLLPSRLTALCAFANGETPATFLHPVLRAILVHLWLAYDHPFEDGNGRTARALFYWCMLRNRYWLAEYLSISSVINRARTAYLRSFLETETDGNDATYFVLAQLRVIVRSIDALHAYLRTKMREVRDTEALLRQADLNHRQLALLSNALRNPDGEYTYVSHARSHGVVRQSARTDLKDLVQRGLLVERKAGRAAVFRPAPDLARLIAEPRPRAR